MRRREAWLAKKRRREEITLFESDYLWVFLMELEWEVCDFKIRRRWRF
jgi:hypothetical protein